MAEGTPVKQDDVVCRFFLTSTCRDGDNCLFSHDNKRSTPDNVCRYFLQGVCCFGQHCRFDHVTIIKEHNSLVARKHASHDVSSNFPGISDAQLRDSKVPRLGYFTCNTVLNEVSSQNVPLSPTTANWTHNLNSEFPCSTSFPNWMHVPEFVPKSKSYADTVRGKTEPEKLPSSKLCSHFMTGECPLEQYCSYVHGDMCELCQKACLHPEDEVQRKHHIEQCEKALEENMEFSFAIQRSKSKTCAICMDVVLEKESLSERRFGILEKCNHVYCLSCIRQWRRGNQQNDEGTEHILDPTLRRSCPQCRIPSDFVTPSIYFVDSEDKNKLISEYKKALSRKHCKYFKNGEGNCPFGLTCFYLHAKRDGTKVQVPALVRRRRENQFGEVMDVGEINLWNFFENRDENVLINFNFSRLNISTSDSDVTTVSE